MEQETGKRPATDNQKLRQESGCWEKREVPDRVSWWVLCPPGLICQMVWHLYLEEAFNKASALKTRAGLHRPTQKQSEQAKVVRFHVSPPKSKQQERAYKHRAMVARQTDNLKVVGSIPTAAFGRRSRSTTRLFFKFLLRLEGIPCQHSKTSGWRSIFSAH